MIMKFKKYLIYFMVGITIWIGWCLLNLIISFTPMSLYKNTPFLFVIYLTLVTFVFLMFWSRKTIRKGKKFRWIFPVIGAICGPILIVIFNNWLTIFELPEDALMSINELFYSYFHHNLVSGDPIGFGLSILFIGLSLGIIFYASIGFGVGMLFYNRKMGVRILAIIFAVSIIPTILAYNYKSQEIEKIKAEEKLMNITELSEHFEVEKRLIKEILIYNDEYDRPSYKGYLPWQRYYEIERVDYWLKSLLSLSELSGRLEVDEKSIKAAIDKRKMNGVKINNILKYDLATIAYLLHRNDIVKEEELKRSKMLTPEEMARYFRVDKEIIVNLIEKYGLGRDAISSNEKTWEYPKEKVRELLKSEGIIKE